MLRFLISLLLLVVVFLSGMIIGIDRGKDQESNIVQQEVEIVPNHIDGETNEHVLSTDSSDTQNEQIINNDILNNDKEVFMTQKVAAFLETGIKGFYELIVNILYQISSLFY